MDATDNAIVACLAMLGSGRSGVVSFLEATQPHPPTLTVAYVCPPSDTRQRYTIDSIDSYDPGASSAMPFCDVYNYLLFRVYERHVQEHGCSHARRMLYHARVARGEIPSPWICSHSASRAAQLTCPDCERQRQLNPSTWWEPR